MSRYTVSVARLIVLLVFPIVVSYVNLSSSPILAQLSSSSLPPALKQPIEDLVKTYIQSHPEIIEQALQTLAAKRHEKDDARVKQAIALRQDELQYDSASPVSGNSDGDVTVVEFFDYRCGFCKHAASIITQLQNEDARVRIVYKDFPILGADSLVASTAALASQSQGRHTAFHEALLAAKEPLTKDQILHIAHDVGLDTEKLLADMDDSRWLTIIKRNQTLARDLRITGTPAFVVGNQLVLGAVDLTVLKTLVAQVRER